MNIIVTGCNNCPFMGLNESLGEYYCHIISRRKDSVIDDCILADKDMEVMPIKCPLRLGFIKVEKSVIVDVNL